GTDDADETAVEDRVGYGCDFLGAADKLYRWRQGFATHGRIEGNSRRNFTPCWSDEGIAASRNGPDVILPGIAAGKCPAQIGDVHLEIRFVHEGARPGPGNQLFFGDKFA